MYHVYIIPTIQYAFALDVSVTIGSTKCPQFPDRQNYIGKIFLFFGFIKLTIILLTYFLSHGFSYFHFCDRFFTEGKFLSGTDF